MKRPPTRHDFRRAVSELDGNTCLHPGCGRTDVNPHHLRYLSESGDNSPANGITLCIEHHKAAHEGRNVEGGWQSGRKYVLWLLGHLSVHRADFRWRKVFRYLRDREELKRVGP
jgi:hypothetical protein